MLALFVNDKSLNLTSDISITLKFASPIFNTIGDHTYPFKLPATALNVSILGFKHRIENSANPYQIFDATLEWNGILILKGTLRILRAQSDFYEATLYMDKGDFFYRRKNYTLQDIDFGEMTWSGETLKVDYFNDCRGHVYPERNFGFPQILNLSYFEQPPLSTCNQWFNYYLTGTMYYFAYEDPRTILVPMLYLRFVLDRIFKKLEYSLEDEFFSTDPEFNALAIYNNVNANCDILGYFNYDKLKVFMSYHVPVMSINDFLSGLESFFNIRFFVNNITKTVKLVSVDKIVKLTQAVEFSRNVTAIYTELGEPITGYHLKMNMNSDDSFTTAMKSNEDLVLGLIKGAVDKVSDLSPWPGSQNMDIKFVRDENRYYIMFNRVWSVSPVSPTDLQLSSEYIYKESSQSIESKFSTLMNEDTGLYPCAVGNAMTEWKDTSPKLFFIKFHPYGGYGTNDEKVYASNYTDNQSLFYRGPTGLFAKHFKAFCDFQMGAKQVKIVKQMNLVELNELDFSKKYAINGNHYLLSEVQVSITNSGIKPATIKAYACL
jgi:hypothetical protein